MSTAETTFETDGPLALLTFNRPEARNAMTWAMYEALVAACEAVDDRSDLRVLLVAGAGGKAFVAGTDISQFERFESGADGVAYEQRMDEVLGRLERVQKPTLAVVQGVAAGGGCVIALTCDLCLATPESTFGIPIARTLGNCVSASTLGRLVGRAGPALIKDLLFTGRFLSAQEALARGVIDRIVPSDEIERAARGLGREIASNAPLTIRATKEILRRHAAQGRLGAGDDRDLIEACYGSADFREGVAAFLAKRRPRWTGK